MGAPVASGTLAGSTSGSWASIRKGAASSDLPRFRRHPPGLAQLCRRRGGRTSSSGTTSKPRKQQREFGVTSVARFVLGEERPSELPVVRQHPPVVRRHTVRRSPAVKTTGPTPATATVALRSRRCSRAHYRIRRAPSGCLPGSSKHRRILSLSTVGTAEPRAWLRLSRKQSRRALPSGDEPVTASSRIAIVLTSARRQSGSCRTAPSRKAGI
jgi:hypothetical protein